MQVLACPCTANPSMATARVFHPTRGPSRAPVECVDGDAAPTGRPPVPAVQRQAPLVDPVQVPQRSHAVLTPRAGHVGLPRQLARGRQSDNQGVGGRRRRAAVRGPGARRGLLLSLSNGLGGALGAAHGWPARWPRGRGGHGGSAQHTCQRGLRAQADPGQQPLGWAEAWGRQRRASWLQRGAGAGGALWGPSLPPGAVAVALCLAHLGIAAAGGRIRKARGQASCCSRGGAHGCDKGRQE